VVTLVTSRARRRAAISVASMNRAKVKSKELVKNNSSVNRQSHQP
jgi:hypothetical protein